MTVMLPPDLVRLRSCCRGFAAVDARPAVTRARAVGTDHAFKQERDEEALRALFPSNYPAVA
jgi:GST-like protein